MTNTFAGSLSLSGYNVTSAYNSSTTRRDVTITSTSFANQPDLTLSWTESGITQLDGTTPATILDPTTFSKVNDGSVGNVEVATLTLSGTTGSGTITLEIGSHTFNVNVTGGDSATNVANKALAVIGTNGVTGYTAVNNGDGTITFTATTPAIVTDLTVTVTN